MSICEYDDHSSANHSTSRMLGRVMNYSIICIPFIEINLFLNLLNIAIYVKVSRMTKTIFCAIELLKMLL